MGSFSDCSGSERRGVTIVGAGRSQSALVVMSFFMRVGRLEIYTRLLLFHPETRKGRRGELSRTYRRE